MENKLFYICMIIVFGFSFGINFLNMIRHKQKHLALTIFFSSVSAVIVLFMILKLSGLI